MPISNICRVGGFLGQIIDGIIYVALYNAWQNIVFFDGELAQKIAVLLHQCGKQLGSIAHRAVVLAQNTKSGIILGGTRRTPN